MLASCFLHASDKKNAALTLMYAALQKN